MKRWPLFLVLCVLIFFAAAFGFAPRLNSNLNESDESTAAGAIRQVILEQQAAWNRGDIDAFMKGYWQSPELTFAGSNGVTRGWKPVLERYRERYGNVQTMGQLDFSHLEVHPLGKDAAFVLGPMASAAHFGRNGRNIHANFSTLPEGWRIVHDHTSADDKDRK